MKKRIAILASICLVAAIAVLTGTTQMTFAASEVRVDTVEKLEQAIHDAGSSSGNTVIVLEPRGGGYELNDEIRVPGRTTVDLNGQVVRFSHGEYAFKLAGHYSSIKDGTVEGAGIRVYSSGDSITGLKINGAPDKGIYMHGKYASLRRIENNTINGLEKGQSVSRNQCGIHIEKGATCGNIRENNILNCKYHAIRINGYRHMKSSEMGASAKDICDNTIKNCGGDGISVYYGSHVRRISRNVLQNIGGHDTKTNGDFAITINAGRKFDTYAEEITDNEIDGVTFAGIVVFGKERTGGGQNTVMNSGKKAGYLKGDISGNVVRHAGSVAKTVNWKKNGKKPYPCEAAIYVDSYAKVNGDIHHNTIEDCWMDGISVITASEVQSVTDNVIRKNKEKYGVRGSGIGVKDSSCVNGNISGNKINRAAYHGILVNNGSSVSGEVSRNRISNTAGSGVFVASSSALKSVTGNTILKSGDYEVFTGKKGRISSLSGNVIKHNNKKTAAVISNAGGSYITKISGNKLSGKYGAGFRINSPKVKVSIIKNSLTSKAKTTFMSINGCKSKTITIRKNKIKGSGKGVGILIRKSKSKIRGNSIKRVSTKIKKVR